MIKTMKEAEDFIYHSYLRANKHIVETLDESIKKPELTKQLFRLLGSPDREQRFILVTGSKGKGSTARFISSLLGHVGMKVGLFTSPHLVHFNERIRISGEAIHDEDFIRLSNHILPFVQQIESQLAPNEYQGPIGLALAIAVLYFRENKTDINVIECGRGGLYDDTNILANEIAVITPIMKEHIHQLGPTIDRVIEHKLGIIKSETNKVYVSQQKEWLANIKSKLKSKAKQITFYEDDFTANEIKMTPNGISFSVKTTKHLYHDLHMPLLGKFQATNAALAVQICEDLVGRRIKQEIIEQCFNSMQWPGRFEVIDTNPTVVIDGAINRETVHYVKEIVQLLRAKKVVSIIGVPYDKDYRGVIQATSQFSHQLIMTKPDISHLQFPEDALEYARSILPCSIETNLLSEAVSIAKEDKTIDLILILGTQTLIANAKRLWQQNVLNIGK